MVHRIGVSPKVKRAIRVDYPIVLPTDMGTYSAVVMMQSEYLGYHLDTRRFRPIVVARIDDLPAVMQDIASTFSK